MLWLCSSSKTSCNTYCAGLATIDLLVWLNFACDNFGLHGSDLLNVSLSSLFHDFVDRDLVIDVTGIERALKQVTDLVVVARNKVILLLLSLSNIWLDADILEPVCISELDLELIK